MGMFTEYNQSVSSTAILIISWIGSNHPRKSVLVGKHYRYKTIPYYQQYGG